MEELLVREDADSVTRAGARDEAEVEAGVEDLVGMLAEAVTVALVPADTADALVAFAGAIVGEE